MSQQLTVRQNQLSNRIAKAGGLSDVAFARSTTEFAKIKDLQPEEIQSGFAMIFVKVANLAGIKEAITGINKADVSEMIMTVFKTLSLEEIDYAFKLERYGVYENKTDHYQLFNSEYVSAILHKYKKWLRTTRVNNNLPLSKPKLALPEMTDAQKQEIVLGGLKDCYENYLSTGQIQPGRLYLYDFLDEKELMPSDIPTKKGILSLAQKNITKQKSLAKNREEKAMYNLLDKLGNTSNKVIAECKRLSLINFFNNHVSYERIEKKIK